MNTEQQILITARKHFVQQGFAGARMQAIADEAGINKALLHYYFRSKADLYDRIVEEIMDRLIPKIVDAVSSSGDVWASLERLVETYIDSLLQDPDIPVFIMGELSQKREDFIVKVRSRMENFQVVQHFVGGLGALMQESNTRKYPPEHLLLNVLGMLVFPFMAKPVFQTIMEMDEERFSELMLERKKLVMDFLRHALTP